MKDIHPTLTKCSFACGTCGNKFLIDTTMKADSYSIDICSKCHPFYIGKANVKQLRGRSEKLSAKFEAGKVRTSSKVTKEPKVKKEKKSTGLDTL